MIRESYLMVDAIAQQDNLFTRMDARIKVLLCTLTLVAVIGIPGFRLPLGVFALVMAALLTIKTPVKLVIGRVVPPMIFGLIIFGLLTFFQSGQQMFVISIAGFKLVGHSEGFYLGLTVLTRIAASVSVLLFLSVSTPVHELGYALMWMRVPEVIVEILLLTYRYLFVLWDEGMRIRQAQTLRLGYSSERNIQAWKHSVKSTSTLMAMVFIRAYDRAESTFSAMQTRAYNGKTSGRNYKSWN